MTSALTTVKKINTESDSEQALQSKTKHNLNKQLEHSLELERAMLQLQQEFRSRSNRISKHVDSLGNLLGIRRVA